MHKAVSSRPSPPAQPLGPIALLLASWDIPTTMPSFKLWAKTNPAPLNTKDMHIYQMHKNKRNRNHDMTCIPSDPEQLQEAQWKLWGEVQSGQHSKIPPSKIPEQLWRQIRGLVWFLDLFYVCECFAHTGMLWTMCGPGAGLVCTEARRHQIPWYWGYRWEAPGRYQKLSTILLQEQQVVQIPESVSSAPNSSSVQICLRPFAHIYPRKANTHI